MFGSSAKGTFDRNIDKATSQLLLEPDWEATLQICDAIRQKDVTPKYALGNIRKKLYDKNPRVTLYALQVLESCVKNCGSGIHEEIATPQFMDDMKELVLSSNEAVKGKSLELIQAWAQAFRNEPSLKIVCDTFSQLKGEGHSFPQLKESDAMFVAEKAPDWAEGERCYSCRTEFGMLQRQHHCRHCGQVFCGKCSSKNCTIPKFGIEKPVRVCDTCHEKLQGKSGSSKSSSGSKESDLPDEYLNSPLAQQSQLPPQRNETDLQEEEELQLAMALSLDEAENKHLIQGKGGKTHATTAPSSVSSSGYNSSSAPAPEPELDPELARYLNRSYWEQKQQETRSGTMPSAPTGGDIVPATAPPLSQSSSSLPQYSQIKTFEEVQNGAPEPENDELVRNMSSSIDVLVNRMKSDSSRGRSIASDTTVQGLFQVLSSMHPRLLKLLQEKEEKRAKMEGLQDKLAQIRDAREALDALREEHREKLRREAEEAERLRQIQMAHKLEIMRRKKQEMLQFQQQQALLKMQEQERERQMWLEQQKQQQQMRQIQYTAYGMSGMGQPGMMSPGGMAPPPGGMAPPPGGMQQPPPGQYAPQQQFGSPSHAPYGMAPPQGGYPGGPPPTTTQMDAGQPTTQVGYNQPPSGYQVPPQQPPQQQQLPPQQPQQQYQQPMAGGGYPSGQYGTPSQQPPPQAQQQPGSMNQNYPSPLSSLDYQQQQQPPPQQQQQPPPQYQQQAGNPYNMQAMAGALPSQNQAPPPAQGQYGSPPLQQPYQPQGQQMMGGGGMQMGPPGMQQGQQPPPGMQQQQPPPPPQQQQREDTLISFE